MRNPILSMYAAKDGQPGMGADSPCGGVCSTSAKNGRGGVRRWLLTATSRWCTGSDH